MHKMTTMIRFSVCLALILCGGNSMGKPLSPEVAEGLLPPTPHDKNETIAAIVQDPVVQDAVQHAASNGSLNGLVVKKNVFIMPATNPNLVLSKREHLLVVPTENLEDVRKNITETKQSEAQEASSTETQAFFEVDASEYVPRENGSVADEDKPVAQQDTDQSVPENEKRKSETEFLKDTISHGAALPEDSSSKKVAVPIVAVIDPSKAENGKVNSPIVAILPNQVNNAALNSQVQFLKDNSDTIQKNAQEYVDRNSLTSSTPSEITIATSQTQGSVAPASLYPDQVSPGLVTQEMFLAPVMVPQWQYTPSLQNDQGDYSRETGDMDVAEDIIFRPLFRYRQQTQQRSKYYDESNNRRYGGYAPYRDYGSYYPRRAYFYRPRYDEY